MDQREEPFVRWRKLVRLDLEDPEGFGRPPNLHRVQVRFPAPDLGDGLRRHQALPFAFELLGEALSLRIVPASLGHVGIGHDATAVGQGLEMHGNDPPVLSLAIVRERLTAAHQPRTEGDGRLFFFGRILAPFGEIAQDLIQRHSVGIEALVQLEEVPQALIIDDDPHIAVEQHDTLFDILEDGLQIRGMSRGFPLAAAEVRKVVTDADIAREDALVREQGRAADPERPHDPLRIHERGFELPKGPTMGEIIEMGAPARTFRVGPLELHAALADDRRGRDAEDARELLRHEREAQLGVHLPPPVGGHLRQQ